MQFTIKDEPFALGYMTSDSDVIAMKIADAFLKQAQEMPLSIHEEWKFAGMNRPDRDVMGQQGVYFQYGQGITVQPDILRKKAENHPDCASEYLAILNFFNGKGTQQHVEDADTIEEHLQRVGNAWWGGRWAGHCNIDFGMFVHEGTDALRDKANKYLPDHPEAKEWYAAVKKSLDALDVLGNRYRELALEKLANCDLEKEKIYRRIVDALTVVPRKPAYDFFSAVQSFMLIFSFDGVDSPGRFDQYMGEYFDAAPYEERMEVLEGLWVYFHDCRAWNLCIGGSDENWNDKTNALSYAILEITTRMRFQTPNLTLRWHRNVQDEFLYAAAKCIATGIGLPSLYNDEVVCPALEKQGIPKMDSHLYAMNGCNQIDIQGKSHMGLEDGEICLLKCLEYALFDGVDLITGLQTSIHTGDATKFEAFDDVWKAFEKQVRYALTQVVHMANTSQRIFSEMSPNPLRSAIVQGCLEKGKDYTCGGPIYNHGQILTEGLADTVDSLLSIKHFVFETKEFSMEKMLSMLQNDFVGEEALRLKLERYPVKFGNDIPEADEMAGKVQRFFFSEMPKHHTWRDPINGTYGGGLSTFQRTARYGRSTGASANGRHASDWRIADSIGATPGRDRNGPTAALCSALHYDHQLATSGFVMQLKFEKSMFNTSEGIKQFVQLVKGYFQGGGQQLSINVLDAKELEDAKIHPEAHEDLIVRVGGYSDYFTHLEPGLQDNIIARSIQGL